MSFECLSYLNAEYDPCPGKYCARLLLNQTTCLFSECQKCPRGYRPYTSNLNLCTLCKDEPSLYDYMYLGFMFNVSTTLNLLFVDRAFINVYKNRSTSSLNPLNVALVYCLPLLENLLAIVFSIFVFSPFGSLSLDTCRIEDFYDFYSLFFDPYIDYFKKLNCNQEIVYPLYSLLIVYIFIATILMITLRPLVRKLVLKKTINSGIVSQSTFASLYFFPIFIIFHLAVSGVLYYTYPIITFVFILIVTNIHMSHVFQTTLMPKETTLQNVLVTLNMFKSRRNVAILAINWYFCIYGIICITQLRNGLLDLLYLLLVPGPLIFFVVSYRYSSI